MIATGWSGGSGRRRLELLFASFAGGRAARPIFACWILRSGRMTLPVALQQQDAIATRPASSWGVQ
jgi:hypothetical protein